MRLYHSPAIPRRIFKTTCQHIVEQYRSHLTLRGRIRRGTMDFARTLSLGAVPPSAERQPPDADAENRPQRMGSIRPYTKSLITRVDMTLKPIDPSGRFSSTIEPVNATQLTASPAQAHLPISLVSSRSSAGHQVNLAGDHLEATPGDVTSPPEPLTTGPTMSLRALGLSLDGFPQSTTHRSANASSVGGGQTENLRRRKTLPVTRTTFSEQPHS
jgi:hypothetical protein